jgi:integrase
MAKKKAESKRRAPGEGGLFQRKSDLMWVGVVDVPTLDGRRRQARVYSTDYAKCVEKLRKLQDNVTKGIIPSPSTTVARWLDYWLEHIRGPHVRPKTRAFYEEAIRLHLKPALGKKRLDRLTAQEVRGALAGITTSRNRQRAYQVLNMALDSAIGDGMLARNVCDAVTKPEHLPADRIAFTADQAKTILRTAIAIEASRDAISADPAMATRWATAFLSGARQGEVLGLEWDRVDLEHGVFDFAWQLQQLKMTHGCPPGNHCGRKRPSYCPQARWDFEDGFEYRKCHKSLVWTRPKTGSGTRVVPIIPGLLAMLRAHAAAPGGPLHAAAAPNPHNLVWHYPDGRPIGPTDDYEYWQALLVTAGITEPKEPGSLVPKTPIPLHSARHSTATLLQAAGVTEEVRMKIMGQSSVAAHRGYIHVDQTQTRAALGQLASILE